MEDKLISFKTAKLAKEKGFDEECLYYYFTKTQSLEFGSYCDGTVPISPHNGFTYRVSAPNQSLLQKWLREVHKLNITIDVDSFAYDFSKITYKCKIWRCLKKDKYKEPEFFGFETYENALEVGLYECLHRVSETVA